MKPNTKPALPALLSINRKFILAFILLRHLFHEAHEFAHMVVARLYSSEWGTRDFNHVEPFPSGTKPTVAAEITTGLAGPLVDYVLCWIGVFLIWKAREVKQTAVGIVLIFASLPFARIFTALVGGGDELGITRIFIADPELARAMNLLALVAILGYPMYIAYKNLPREKRLWTWLGFLFLPMFLEGAFVLGLLNWILKTGFLAQQSVCGAPLFVMAILVPTAVLFCFLAPSVTSFLKPKEKLELKPKKVDMPAVLLN